MNYIPIRELSFPFHLNFYLNHLLMGGANHDLLDIIRLYIIRIFQCIIKMTNYLLMGGVNHDLFDI